MSRICQAIRGMNDILPEDSAKWEAVEAIVRRVFPSYGYREIRFPMVEHTELFCRSIGETTDIVEKEMYTFEDRSGARLTLRPEGTASCVRAGIEHGLFYHQVQRLWYLGPMFRHERPQKGRYRQFHQLGVEAFGMPGPDVDAEIIFMTSRLWTSLGLKPSEVALSVNSLGSSEARKRYLGQLVDYFSSHVPRLDAESARRLKTNPMRILDSKNPEMQELIKAAPKLLEHLDDDSRVHFDALCATLEAAGIAYQVNPRLVRGLDYYTKTVFEWTAQGLGSQNAICGGGRYDGLVEYLGGEPTPAVGFAIGFERLLEVLEAFERLPTLPPPVDIYVTVDTPTREALLFAEELRSALPGHRIEVNCGPGNLKAQLKRADASGAVFAVLVKEADYPQGFVEVKFLRDKDRGQVRMRKEEVPEVLVRTKEI